MSTSYGWEGKGRYGSFHQRMNTGVQVTRKTVRFLENACPTWVP